MRHTDAIIIGAGPAGVAAAIQLHRSRVRFTLFEREEVGGLTRTANLIENYPGIPGGVPGERFARLLGEHLESTGITVTREEAREVRNEGGKFLVSTSGGSYSSRALVVASGTKPKKFTLPGIESLQEGAVFYESRHVPEGREPAHVIVLGGSDAAFDYAMWLAGKGRRVSIVMRTEKPSCLPLLLERALSHASIEVKRGMQDLRVEGSGRDILIHGAAGGKKVTVRGDYLLLAFGREPAIDFLGEELRSECTPHSPAGKTSQGLYFAGDVRHGLFRQVAIAAGDGILAAMMAKRFLEGVNE
jgi:thioredoxin reductase (NADPH)